MSRPRPLAVAEWREYLRRYSAEFLGSDYLSVAEAEGRAKWMLSPAQRTARWLGFESASEQVLAEAERRLGTGLPPSYRNFLLTSNGWSTIRYWHSSVDLLGADKIGWFPDLEPEILNAWSDLGSYAREFAVLKRSLLISEDHGGGSGCYWLLDAHSVAANGEWKAYEWWPGDGGTIEAYDDFAAMATL
jgi:hypothetical protein